MALTGPYGVRGPNSGDPNKSSSSFADALAQLSKTVTGSGTTQAQANPYGIRQPQGNIGFGSQATALDQMGSLAQSGTPTNALAQMNAVFGPTSTVPATRSAASPALQNLAANNPAPQASGAKTAGNLGTNQATTPFGKYISQNADWNAMLQNPDQITSAYYNFHNMPQHSGGEAMLNNLAPSLPLLYTLMNGGNPQSMSNTGMMDWMGKYIDQSNTPGGIGVGPQDVANAIFTKDKNSVVFNQLYGADLTPTQQVGNVISALRYGLAPSVATPMLNSILARASDLGNNFVTWRNTHPDGGYTFGDYLEQQGFKI